LDVRGIGRAGFEMTHRWLKYAIFAPAIAIVLLIGTYIYWLESPSSLPPLLRNLEATGGWTDACPVPEALRDVLPIADTPEFNRRLSREFPAGSMEGHLITTLEQIGFKMIGGCKDDPTIHIARFDQTVSTLDLFPTPLTAMVYWKTDARKNVVWTKGFIAYTGP
jgi:hypothetical protein